MAKREKELLPDPEAAQELPFGPSADELLKIDKMIRIAVSGDVFVTKFERDIIDTPDFQRLRGVRQLGNVLHVYPTALHTRFDHSLGTLAMANRMLQAIKNNRASEPKERSIEPIQEVIARLYALLHDITHVPFGHTIEDELGILTRHDNNPSRILRFLGPDSPIGTTIRRYIGPDGYGRFMTVYNWLDKEDERKERAKKDSGWGSLAEWLEPTESNDDIFIHDLVSNTVCADLLDYVARDSYFCNLDIGLDYRFINFLYLGKAQGSPFRRVFVRLWKGRQHAPRRDTMTDLARLLEARYMIAERAYFHHAKIISGTMLGRALQEQLLAGLLKEEDLYDHTDDTLLRTLRNSPSKIPAMLATALWGRQLHKLINSPYTNAAFDAVQSGDIEDNAKEHAYKVLGTSASRRLIENELAEQVGAEHGDVLIYAPYLDMNPKAAEMNVRWHGKDKKFKDIDDAIMKPRLEQIIRSHHLLWGIHLLATKRIADDPKRRALLLEAFETEFLCPRIEQDRRKLDHYEKVVEFTVSDGKYAVSPGPYRDIKERITNAAKSLMITSKDDRPFRDRLKEAISTHLSKP
jgi:uncharacterized protein